VRKAGFEVRVPVNVERNKETGVFVASWNDPRGGGITTQAESLAELGGAIQEAFFCHFERDTGPHQVNVEVDSTGQVMVSLHFANGPILELA